MQLLAGGRTVSVPRDPSNPTFAVRGLLGDRDHFVRRAQIARRTQALIALGVLPEPSGVAERYAEESEES